MSNPDESEYNYERLAQHDNENDSPPTEGMAEGQGWVSSEESFP